MVGDRNWSIAKKTSNENSFATRHKIVNFAIRASLALLALPLFQPAQAPGIDLADYEGDSGFTAKIDGKDVRVVMSPRWPDSYFVGGDGSTKNVLVDGKSVVKVAFREGGKETLYPNTDAVLGLDGLKKMCIVIDPIWEKMEVLPSTKIGLAGAKEYFSRLPAWGSPAKIVRIPLTSSDSGAPMISPTIDGQVTPLLFNLSLYNTMIDEKVKHPQDPVGPDDWSFLPSVSYPGLAPAWFSYSAEADWDAAAEGGNGMIALDTFVSRKVIVDLADDAVYVEELAPDARLALSFYRIIGLPVSIVGDTLKVAAMPGVIEEDGVGELNGCKVVSLARIPAAEWLSDLRVKTPGAAARISKRAPLFDKKFEVTVIQPDGTQKTVTIDGSDNGGSNSALKGLSRHLKLSH